MYKELLDSCGDCDDKRAIDIIDSEVLEAGGSGSVEEGEGVDNEGTACSAVLEAGGSGGVEETSVETVIVVSLNRTSAM